jgi:hypothetical protein
MVAKKGKRINVARGYLARLRDKKFTGGRTPEWQYGWRLAKEHQEKGIVPPSIPLDANSSSHVTMKEIYLSLK